MKIEKIIDALKGKFEKAKWRMKGLALIVKILMRK